MKMIRAIIRHFVLAELAERLNDTGFGGMTVSEAIHYHGEDFLGIPMNLVEIVLKDEDVEEVVTAIMSVAMEGMIYVFDMEGAINIRTGDRGV